MVVLVPRTFYFRVLFLMVYKQQMMILKFCSNCRDIKWKLIACWDKRCSLFFFILTDLLIGWLVDLQKNLLAELVGTPSNSAAEVKEKLVFAWHPKWAFINARRFPISPRCSALTSLLSRAPSFWTICLKKKKKDRQYEKCELDKSNLNAFHKMVHVWPSSAFISKVLHPCHPAVTSRFFDEEPRQ